VVSLTFGFVSVIVVCSIAYIISIKGLISTKTQIFVSVLALIIQILFYSSGKIYNFILEIIK